MVANRSFHGFVCFQWLDPVFVSLCQQGRGGGDSRGRKIALRQEPPPVSDPIGFAPSGRKTGRRFLAGGSQAGFAGEPAQPSPGGGRTTVRARSSHSANPFPEPALLAGRYRLKWPSEAELRPNPGDPLNAASLPLGRPIRTGARARIGVAASHRSYNALINLQKFAAVGWRPNRVTIMQHGPGNGVSAPVYEENSLCPNLEKVWCCR